MKLCRNGITRWVVLMGPWAIKVPRAHRRPKGVDMAGMWWSFVRGWLANRSEARHGEWTDAVVPRSFVWGLVIVMRRARRVGSDTEPLEGPWVPSYCNPYIGDGDAEKPDSWGLFNGQWLLIDHDNTVQERKQDWLAERYYAAEERRVRGWNLNP